MALTKIQTTAIEDSAVTSAKIANGTIATGDIEAKAITTGLMADGTDGQLFTLDSSAVITTVPTGGATQVLTAQGAGAKPVFQDVVDNAAAMALALGG